MANKLNRVVNKPKGKKQQPVPVKIVSDANTIGAYPAIKKNGVDKYEAQDALRTLQRAAEIQKNKPLMRAAKAEAKSMIKNLSKVVC